MVTNPLFIQLYTVLSVVPSTLSCRNRIHQLPTMGFDNLNSLETLNLQNNKLQHIPEEIMEPILDTLRVVDIMG